jgi:hypothetical protein
MTNGAECGRLLDILEQISRDVATPSVNVRPTDYTRYSLAEIASFAKVEDGSIG